MKRAKKELPPTPTPTPLAFPPTITLLLTQPHAQTGLKNTAKPALNSLMYKHFHALYSASSKRAESSTMRWRPCVTYLYLAQLAQPFRWSGFGWGLLAFKITASLYLGRKREGGALTATKVQHRKEEEVGRGRNSLKAQLQFMEGNRVLEK